MASDYSPRAAAVPLGSTDADDGTCRAEGCSERGVFVCKRCVMGVRYCGRECQRRDWHARHKKVCNEADQFHRVAADAAVYMQQMVLPPTPHIDEQDLRNALSLFASRGHVIPPEKLVGFVRGLDEAAAHDGFASGAPCPEMQPMFDYLFKRARARKSQQQT